MMPVFVSGSIRSFHNAAFDAVGLYATPGAVRLKQGFVQFDVVNPAKTVAFASRSFV